MPGRADRLKRLAELRREVAQIEEELGFTTAPTEVPEWPESLPAQILEHASDLISVHAANGDYVYASASAEALFGWPPDELMGRSAYELVHPDDLERISAEHARHLDGEQGGKVGYRLRCKDGRYRWVETLSRPWRRDGTLVGIICFTRDVHASRAGQLEALEANSALSSMGLVMAGVLHEINSPMSTVLANLDYCVSAAGELVQADPSARSKDVDEVVAELREALDDAREGALRVGAVTNSLWQFLRPNNQELEAIDLQEAFESSLRIVRPDLGMVARVERDYRTDAMAWARRFEIGQVMLNLLVNACQAIGPGDPRRNTITVGSERRGDQVRFWVADTGPGIADDEVVRIFQPLFSTKEGTGNAGLGLWVCKNLIDGMNGRLEVERSAEGGAKFVVTVAVAGTHDADLVPAKREVLPRRILIVDDDVVFARSLERNLREDHDVTAVDGGSQALARIADDDGQFDLILCDVFMPVIHGGEFLEVLRRSHPDLVSHVVFMTGLKMRASEVIGATDNRCLEKPIRREDIDDVLEQLTAPQSA